LLFTLWLWVSVCLALYIAFWLELDKPFWAGASAAIVSPPQLGCGWPQRVPVRIRFDEVPDGVQLPA
jgi:uncharacterized membrane protein YccC